MRVGVIDYGVGNLSSVLRAIEELRVVPVLVTRAMELSSIDRMILPGVGNFSDCAALLAAGGWVAAIADEAKGKGKPLLGICVGMQLLADYSSEGSDVPGQKTAGLGLIPGRVDHLASLGCNLRVPHVGWNEIRVQGSAEVLLTGIPQTTDFYFVHSFAFVPDDPADVVAVTDYGVEFAAVVRRGNVWGTQFHPEKSSRAGLRVLGNYIRGPAC